MSNSDMEKINAYTRRELTESEVYIFPLTLCDNEVDRDFECFSLSALEELKTLFPGKTGIFDHSMKSADQKARIFETYLERAEGETTQYGAPLVRLKARAYMLRNEENRALIEEIEAGIKKEVSVSCSMEKATCSVCGKDRRTERCSHIGGKSYGGKLCYTTLSDAGDAYEFSFVAVPAQRGAGVTKAYQPKEDFAVKEMLQKMRGEDTGATLSAAQVKQLGGYIESLEEEAKLGELYKKELTAQVTRLLSLRLPEIERKLFDSVTAVMTVNELLGFKQGLEKSAEAPAPQLAAAEGKAARDYSQFRI